MICSKKIPPQTSVVNDNMYAYVPHDAGGFYALTAAGYFHVCLIRVGLWARLEYSYATIQHSSPRKKRGQENLETTEEKRGKMCGFF